MIRWLNFHPEQPWRTWFWAWRFFGLPDGLYEFYKIPPEGEHQEQLAFKSPVTRIAPYWYNLTVKANTLYIMTLPGDLPNWGNIGQLVGMSPPCANWTATIYTGDVTEEVTRSQTYGLLGAVQINRETSAKVSAAVAKNDELVCGVTATIQAAPELPIEMRAAIMGNPELDYPIRAAVRTERLLEPAITASISKDFSLAPGVTATIQGNPLQWYGARAAIKGETERSVGIKAFVVKSRVNQIMLEMENLWPQELDLRSTPNSPSKWNDWRTDQLGE